MRSPSDRREYHLRPIRKYMKYDYVSTSCLQSAMGRIKVPFTPDGAGQLDRMLCIVDRELMPEVDTK